MKYKRLNTISSKALTWKTLSIVSLLALGILSTSVYRTKNTYTGEQLRSRATAIATIFCQRDYDHGVCSSMVLTKEIREADGFYRSSSHYVFAVEVSSNQLRPIPVGLYDNGDIRSCDDSNICHLNTEQK